FKAERDWYKLERDMYKTMIGGAPEKPEDKAELVRQKEALDKNQSKIVTDLGASGVKAEVAPAQAYMTALKTDHGLSWDTEKGQKEPPRSFKSLVRDKDTSYGDLAKRVAALEVERN